MLRVYRFALVVLTSLIVFGSSRIMPVAETLEKSAKVFAQDEIKSKIRDSHDDYYDIHSIEVTYIDSQMMKDCMEIRMNARLLATLKAKSVEELPFIKGYLNAGSFEGLMSSHAINQDSIYERLSIQKERALTEYQKEFIVKSIVEMFSNLNTYICEETEINFGAIVKIPFNLGQLRFKDAVFLGENIDSVCPFESLMPRSYEEMYDAGSQTMSELLSKANELKERLHEKAVSYTYNADDAGFYSGIYVVNATSCDAHASGCTIKQDTSAWNLSRYPNYTNHKDCANFVSQALAYGGLPTDSTWQYPVGGSGTLAWINTNSLLDYMLEKGYFTETNFNNSSRGTVLFTSSGHVTMIATYNTINHAYNAHTNDVYRKAFSDNSNYKYYNVG
jgi:hypothetical protein